MLLSDHSTPQWIISSSCLKLGKQWNWSFILVQNSTSKYTRNSTGGLQCWWSALFWLMWGHWLRSLLGWTTVSAWVYCGSHSAIKAETHWTHILFPHRWTHSAGDQLQISPDTGAVWEAHAEGIKDSRELWRAWRQTLSDIMTDEWWQKSRRTHSVKQHLKLQEGSTIPQFIRQSNMWKWSS